MAPRDYTSSPVADGLGLHEVCLGLSQDLADLRGGKISPQEALARAALARQLFNGCRLYLQAIKTMVDLHRFCSGHVLMLGGPLFEGHW